MRQMVGSYLYNNAGKTTSSRFFTLDWKYATPLDWQALQNRKGEAIAAQKKLHEASDAPIAWLGLPATFPQSDINYIQDTAQSMRSAAALVVVGIGGSYLGARAVKEALSPCYFEDPSKWNVYFAGYQLDALYHQQLLEQLKGKRYALNVISKSGTTLEPALAFRLFWNDLSKRYSAEELQKLVYLTTDATSSSLNSFAKQHKLPVFVIPDDIGGRFSVLTVTGLLPLAAAGIAISELLEGARQMRELLCHSDFESNPALQYAAYRQSAYRDGKKIEILGTYQPQLRYLAAWWQQLFGESEGKAGQGIFPAILNFTTDLHSMGQWVQEGERSIFQTVLDIEAGSTMNLRVPKLNQEDSQDKLNYLNNQLYHGINRSALEGALAAHHSGQVPCLRIAFKEWNATVLGALIYFFEYACAVSAYMSGVNPFNQPGVEAYKRNMQKILHGL